MKVPHDARIWCEVSFAALRHNLRALRKIVPKGTRILAVVKDDAYGHGLVPVARTLAQAGCEEFGVACASEGVALRGAGIRQPILLLGSTLPSEYPLALQHRLTITISSIQEARELAQAASKARSIALVQAKLDTGMNRLGARPRDFSSLLFFLARQPHLDLVGTFTHLACADSDLPFTQRQLKQSALLPPNLPHHWANTAALLRRFRVSTTHVRPGLGLYGIDPLGRFNPKLRPVLSWKSRVLLVREILPGETLSYGATFQAKRKLQVATVATGYAHGLPRSLSNRGHALIHGQLCPILGRVTMDMTLLDVSRLPRVRRGGGGVWIGRSGKVTRTATHLAKEAGTIPWEIFTRIHSDISRVFI